MKKKLLCLILLLAMLITAIPFTAFAADAAVTEEESNSQATDETVRTKYHDLYVGHDLVGLFTAFAGDDTVSLSGGAGSWTNRVTGGSSATLAGTTGWSVGTYGGVGFDVVYGQIDANGTFMASYDGNTYANANKLVFALSLLPKDDFTLEYVAAYAPHYVYDARVGAIVAAHETGVSTATTPNKVPSEPVDVIGFMASYSTHPGNAFNDVGGYAGLRWRTVDKNGVHTWDTTYGAGGYDFIHRQSYGAETYALTRDEATAGEGESLVTTATYVHYLNRVAKKTINVTSLTTQGTGRYFNYDDDTEFYLSYRLGTTFYALRVYSAVLTDAEMKHNRAVDALNYYAVEIPESLLAEDTVMDRILNALSLYPLETDASAYAAKKAQAQSVVDRAMLKFADLHNYYVKEGLTLLYSTYGEYAATVDLAAGTWTDIVSGKQASLDVPARWRVNEDGSVGFDGFYGTLNADGTYTSSSSGNNVTANVKLNLGISSLPTEDFTVEYMAKYKPLYLYDATAADHIMRDDDGAALETFDYNIETTGIFVHKLAVDNLGWFQGLASAIDGVIHWRYNASGGNLTDEELRATRGIIHWTFAMHNGDEGGWYLDNSGRQRWWLGSAGAQRAWGGLNIMGDVFQQNGTIRTYAISVDETVTSAGDTEAIFSLYRNAVFYNSNEEQGEVNTSAKGMADGGYIATEFDSKCRFWLSANRPTDFYAVRVYDRVLSEAQRRQNYAVDVMLYYDLDVSDALLQDPDVLSRLGIVFSDVTLAQDATAYAALRAYLQVFVSAEEQRNDLLDLYAAKENLTALFTAFYPDTVDLAAGKWTDIVSGKQASLDVPARWSVSEEGAVGFDCLYGTLNAEGVYTASASGNNVAANTKLNFGIALLPTEDFTVEYMAKYKPVYLYDAGAADHIMRDADGAPLETFDYNMDTTGLFVHKLSVDNLGWFQGLASAIDGVIYSGWRYNASGGNLTDEEVRATRGIIHWTFAMHNGDEGGWYLDNSGRQRWWLGSAGTQRAWGGLNIMGDVFQQNGVIRTYAISVDETVTAAGDTEAVFSLYRDATFYNSNKAQGEINTSAKGMADGGYIAGEFDSKCRFWLSANRPTDFFGVRIYNKDLTAEERMRNRAVDAMLYYGIALAPDVKNNDSILKQLVGIFSAAPFYSDITARAAKRAALQKSVDNAAENLVRAEEMKALYAQGDKLEAFFTVGLAETVDMNGGSWYDLVGGNVATLGNKSLWHKNADGSLGYHIFYGTINAEGAYTESSPYNNYATKGTRLEFGIDLLPKDDFTVEYVASYHPVYLADSEGGIYKDKDGNRLETMSYLANTPGSQQYGGNSTAPIDSLGFFHSWTTNRDGKFSGTGYRGGLYWCFGNLMLSDASDGWSAYYWSQSLYKSNDSFYRRDSIHSYAITRSEVTASNGVVVATYALLRDGTTFASRAIDKPTFEAAAQNTKGYSLDFADDDTGYFYLAERLPVDFYAVRVYSVKLTEAERARNRFMDLVRYYDVALPDFVKENDTLVAQLSAKTAETAFATDATGKAAAKALLADAIAEIEKVSATNTLYVQDGLVSLFTAFAGEDELLSPSGSDMLWQNRVLGNGNATFEKTGWTYNAALGGVGYDLIYGTVDTEKGTFSTACSQDTYARGNRLNLGLDLLPKADFTLEYVAYYSPVLSYDTATGELVDTYATGISAAVTPTAGVYEPVDTVGFLSSYTTQHGGLFYVNSGVYVLGLLRWRSMDKEGYKTWEANGYGWGGSLVTANRASRTVETYAITRDEETQGDVVTAVYTHRLGGVFVDDNSFSSANTTGEHRYYDFEDDTEFYLSYKLGTTFYALRIYDRVLSVAEQKQNRMADLLGFYGIMIPEDFFENEERYEYVVSVCEELTFARDASAYNANKTLLQTAVAGDGNLVTLIVDGTETPEIVYGDSYLLPESVNGKGIFSWKLIGGEADGEKYAPGQIVSVTGGATLRAITLTAPATRYGVSIKPMGDDGFGMRFTATLDKEEYVTLAQEYGQGYIRLSMLITPKVYVDRAGAFTREALRGYVERNAGDPAKAFIEIPLTGFYSVDESVCTVAGTVYKFSTVTREKNVSFAAIACIEVDTDRDGRVDKTVYGTYSPATCRSPKSAVESVQYSGASITDTQKMWLDNFLAYYQNKTYGKEGDKTVNEQREEIKNAFESAMNTVVDYTVHPFAEGEVAEKYAHIQAISFDGLTMGGKKTRVFAYVGLPEGASAENPVPAMVLVHGGGGHAYMEWVRLWNERGYAAIAMENVGYFPTAPGSGVTEGNAPAKREFPEFILDVIDEEEYVIAPDRVMASSYTEVDEQWQYHGLSAVILSHNVLRQNAAVDASRIGTIGVSWGGTMVSQVIGYDTRFAFAIPIYGTAYISEPERPFIGSQYVDDLWAAERNLNNFKNPILWFAWADDNNFVVNSYNKSYLQSLQNNPNSAMTLLADWRHSHQHGWNKEHGYAFADAICFPERAAAYARFTSQPEGQDLTSKVSLPAGATNVKVRFHYLTEPMTYKSFDKYGFVSSYLAEYWKTNVADIAIDPATGEITGTVPKDVRSYYISVTYEVNGVQLETSSSFVAVR